MHDTEFDKPQIILVAPLNWGLGHASRCIPLIKKWNIEGHRIILSANGEAASLLHKEFPALSFVKLPEWKIRYSSNRSQIFSLLWQLPALLVSNIIEHWKLRKIVKKYHISLIVSDNRFGLWHRHIKSIYITHQLMIKVPQPMQWAEPLLWKIHHWIIIQYDECWIPDIASQDNLSGDLSHRYPLPKHAHFIGWLSRFPVDKRITIKKHYHTLCLISGPEPHRTLLEQSLIYRFQSQNTPTLIVQGKPSIEQHWQSIGNIDIVSHLDTTEMQTYIIDTPDLICRSGYSTLMDLKVLNKNATELIPTPGQTEQIYLMQWNNPSKKHL
ncbi:glycosyltransferase [Microbacter margulisiae]|uniref:Glycosyltransferase n=1 Tax=Microbacter margulisiae TaxID=1350067 RepID=A0A7W5DS35_9PORP|nr:glycosyltransferase [Microbacter margulisiae]MBB3187584.1 hypothetical protein [Microbacter margulisiae]